MNQLWKLGLALFVILFGSGAVGQGNADWTTPLTPFKIADGLYYVGSKDLASYLVVTSEGNILINSSLESSPPLIRKSIEQLGFRYRDIKVLLISHAHWDHDAGSARVIQDTGAKYMVMDGDVSSSKAAARRISPMATVPIPKPKSLACYTTATRWVRSANPCGSIPLDTKLQWQNASRRSRRS